jgi:membrane protein required for colicin V production
MNYLDIILILPLLYGAWKGYKKGLIIELFTLLALLVGLYAAINFSDYMVEILKDNLEMTGKYVPVVAFICTFLIIGAMVYFLGKVLEKAIKVVQLSAINKFGGICFGVSKMLMVSGVIVVVLESIDQRNDFISGELKETSLLYEPFKRITLTTIPAVKESPLLKEDSFLNKLKNGADDLKSDLKGE